MPISQTDMIEVVQASIERAEKEGDDTRTWAVIVLDDLRAALAQRVVDLEVFGPASSPEHMRDRILCALDTTPVPYIVD